MKITVLAPSSVVVVDGDKRLVSLPEDAPADLHAIQWYAGDREYGYGEIELGDRNKVVTGYEFDIVPYLRAWEQGTQEK